MRGQRMVFVVVASAVAGSVALAQPGRGGSQWLTSLADAQRTSWVRTDEKISVGTLSKPGFEQQWKAKLDNQPRGPHGLGQGVTASGVTLFVPISLVTGSSNNVYAIDNSGMTMTTVQRGTVKGDTWTFTCGQKVKVRVTLKEVSPTSYTFMMEMQDADGKWAPMIESTSTKSK